MEQKRTPVRRTSNTDRNRRNNKRRFSENMRRKMTVVISVIFVCMICLIGRIIFLYETKGEKYSNAVLSHLSYTGSTIPYERGTITDRNGIVLAQSQEIYNVIMDATVILSDDEGSYTEPTLKALSQTFELNYSDLKTTLTENSKSQYIVLKKGISYDAVKTFKELEESDSNIKGIWFELEYTRTYPFDSLASHVIGYTNSGNVGTYGIEQTYNDYLNGTDGRSYGYYDNELNLVETTVAAEDGATVVSTIDSFCQEIVEDVMSDFMEEYTVENAAVILMNPNTGEIYAMASNTGYDLNNPRDLSALYSEEELAEMTDTEKSNALNNMWRNYTVCDTYEPGSTYKLITVSAALEENAVQVSDTAEYDCGGYKNVGIWKIRCSNRNGHGPLTLTQGIEKSCNVVLMDVGFALGAEKFLKYQKLFGFGEKTGIDLPGEATGILLDEASMGDAELATSTFGQSFNVTMVQMAAAYSSLINGGYYYRPHVVSKVVNSNGVTVYSADDTLMKTTVSKETSDYMRLATESVVENGTGSNAAVEGYKVGGKTGTAQKGNRADRLFVVSFIGSVPADDPQLVSYVVLDQIDDETYYNTSKLAAKMTSDILSRVVAHLGIYPEEGDIDYHLEDYEDETNEGVDVEELTEEEQAALEAEGSTEGETN
jgi:stage V sporulation protein D (sporulation-specific penicillin-binding protein)